MIRKRAPAGGEEVLYAWFSLLLKRNAFCEEVFEHVTRREFQGRGWQNIHVTRLLVQGVHGALYAQDAFPIALPRQERNNWG